jgi:hypothetical protein
MKVLLPFRCHVGVWLVLQEMVIGQNSRRMDDSGTAVAGKGIAAVAGKGIAAWKS